MWINLIKLVQSAAEQSDFKKACKLHDSVWEKKIQYVCSPSLLNSTFQHYYCTSQEQNFSADNHKLNGNRSPTLQI